MLAVGVVIALAAGLWVRSLFRGTALEPVEASAASSTAAPEPPPDWTPPVLSYPPVVGYNTGIPASMAALAIQAGPATGAVEPVTLNTGMTSIAPPSQPTHKTAFTDADLERLRGDSGAPAAPATAAVGGPSAPAAAATPSAAAAAASDGDARKWVSRVRERQDDVQEAQAKVRRMEIEAEARRAHAGAVAADVEAHEKAQREVMEAIEDLEKAERKLGDKQRELDETMDEARSAGVRFN